MPDAVPSDHDGIESHRVHLSSVGHTGRLQLLLPDAVSCTEGDICYLSLSGTPVFAQIDSTLRDDLAIRAAYTNRKQAREQTGENRLQDWFESHSLTGGDALVLDVLTAGYAYGLRAPGDRVIYEPPDKPDSSLASIADRLDDS